MSLHHLHAICLLGKSTRSTSPVTITSSSYCIFSLYLYSFQLCFFQWLNVTNAIKTTDLDIGICGVIFKRKQLVSQWYCPPPPSHIQNVAVNFVARFDEAPMGRRLTLINIYFVYNK